MKIVKTVIFPAILLIFVFIAADVTAQGNSADKNRDQNKASVQSNANQALKNAIDWKTSKLGPQNLRELIARIATESAVTSTGSAKGKKVGRIKAKAASPSGQLRRRAVSGVITGIDANVVTIAQLIHRERIYQVVVADATVITMKGNSAPTMADLKLGDRVIAVGGYLDGEL